jgi:hypothetical protein
VVCIILGNIILPQDLKNDDLDPSRTDDLEEIPNLESHALASELQSLNCFFSKNSGGRWGSGEAIYSG